MTRPSKTLPLAIADCSGCLRSAVSGLFFHVGLMRQVIESQKLLSKQMERLASLQPQLRAVA